MTDLMNVIGGALVWFEIVVDGLASPNDAGISNRESLIII
jgi:hypothetical protein